MSQSPSDSAELREVIQSVYGLQLAREMLKAFDRAGGAGTRVGYAQPASTAAAAGQRATATEPAPTVDASEDEKFYDWTEEAKETEDEEFDDEVEVEMAESSNSRTGGLRPQPKYPRKAMPGVGKRRRLTRQQRVVPTKKVVRKRKHHGRRCLRCGGPYLHVSQARSYGKEPGCQDCGHQSRKMRQRISEA